MGALDDKAPGEPNGANPNYHSYLVRIWRDSQRAPWHASMTRVATGEVIKFGSPQLLWEFVQRQLAALPEDETGPAPKNS